MTSGIGISEKAEQRLDLIGAVARLAGASTSDLTSVFMEVARQRAEARPPRDVLAGWMGDKYVAPVAIDQRALLRLELALLEELRAFEAVELSPLAPLGACSTFSAGGQNRVLAAARNLEVIADPTNCLALESARRRRSTTGALRLCTRARLTRCQPLVEAHHTRHFSLVALTTAERDKDSRAFACRALAEHIDAHLALHRRALAGVADAAPATRLVLYATPPMQETAQGLAERYGATVEPLTKAYYGGLRFTMWLRIGSDEVPVSDGGVFDWLATLASDRKERLAASAMGSELVARLIAR